MSTLRIAFFVLVLLNLGLLAWFHWIVERPEPQPLYAGPGITLLREIDRSEFVEPPRGGQAGLATSAAGGPPDFAVAESRAVGAFTGGSNLLAEIDGDPAVDAGRCASIGPFLASTAADSAMATLIASGFDPRRSIRPAQVWEGFRVYVDRIDDPSAAGAIVSRIREAGIDAAPVISGAGGRLLISLGVHADFASAEAEAVAVDELGYEAKITDSMITAETQWLDLRLADDVAIDLELLQPPGRISRLEQLPCPDDG